MIDMECRACNGYGERLVRIPFERHEVHYRKCRRCGGKGTVSCPEIPDNCVNAEIPEKSS